MSLKFIYVISFYNKSPLLKIMAWFRIISTNGDPFHDDVIKWKHFPRYRPFVRGEFPTQRPVTRSFDVYFDLRLNKRLCKQSRGWWFETLLCPLAHYDVTVMSLTLVCTATRYIEMTDTEPTKASCICIMFVYIVCIPLMTWFHNNWLTTSPRT